MKNVVTKLSSLTKALITWTGQLPQVYSLSQCRGDEGTDFARSARQEKLISAFKQKVLSSPTKLFQLKNILLAGVVTDVTPDLYFPLAKLAFKSARTQLRTAAITEPLVYTPPISATQDYQWVLLPKDGAFSVLASYVKDLLAVPLKK